MSSNSKKKTATKQQQKGAGNNQRQQPLPQPADGELAATTSKWFFFVVFFLSIEMSHSARNLNIDNSIQFALIRGDHFQIEDRVTVHTQRLSARK